MHTVTENAKCDECGKSAESVVALKNQALCADCLFAVMELMPVPKVTFTTGSFSDAMAQSIAKQVDG
jgi:NMD protein affecting ribosome stability and mRNA decay